MEKQLHQKFEQAKQPYIVLSCRVKRRYSGKTWEKYGGNDSWHSCAFADGRVAAIAGLGYFCKATG